ncbi:MAG TPA: NEW3 domain-containing protein [Candidatus Cloacimonadota bacterium]|nr:NEW3 domain-containing protein [Candidatus Cloacimonadota bacterium]
MSNKSTIDRSMMRGFILKYKYNYRQIIFVFLCFVASFLQAQTYQEYNPNDERFKIIALEKAKIRLDNSERDYLAAKKLFDENFISKDELYVYELQYKTDKLNYDQYMLSVIFDNPYINIMKAVKTKDKNDEVFVDLTIKNSTGSNYALETTMMADMSGSKLDATEIFNLYVSIKDMERNIISQPYEHHVKKLKLNQEYSMRFKLLKDVESVIVSTNYGDKIDEKQIYLTKKQDANLITIRPDVYAQEIEMGQMATFKLGMEYFGNNRQSFIAELVGLPDKYNWDIVSMQSNVTMSRLDFSPADAQQSYALRIRVPEQIGENSELDKTIYFQLVLRNQQKDIVGTADLEIAPTAKANMKLIVNNLYWKGNETETISFSQIYLENEGMKAISNISADLFLPSEWEYEITPNKIEQLNPNTRMLIDIKIKTPKNVLPGIYQIKFKMVGNNVNRILQTSEVELKVEISKKTNIMVIILSVILSLALIVGTIWFIVKISKN